MWLSFYFSFRGLPLMLMCVFNLEKKCLGRKGMSGSVCVHTHSYSHRDIWRLRSRKLQDDIAHSLKFILSIKQVSVDVLFWCPWGLFEVNILFIFNLFGNFKYQYTVFVKFLHPASLPMHLGPSTILYLDKVIAHNIGWPETCNPPSSLNLRNTNTSHLFSAVFFRHDRKQ